MQSALNKGDNLSYILDGITCSFDVIFLSETWYRSDADVMYLPGYKAFFVNRPHKRGGGVAMLVKERLTCELLSTHCLSNDDVELLTVRSGQNIFSVIYRPPHGSLTEFFAIFEREITFLSGNFLSIIAGDFNIDMGTSSSAQQQMLVAIQSASFENVINNPTRVTPTSSSVLDLIITNHTGLYKSGRIAVDISDHLPVFLCIEKELEPQRTVQARRQVVSQSRLETFGNRIAAMDWTPVFNEATAARAYAVFLELFLPIYTDCFPIIDITPCRKARKPWMTPRLTRLVKKSTNSFPPSSKPSKMSY